MFHAKSHEHEHDVKFMFAHVVAQRVKHNLFQALGRWNGVLEAEAARPEAEPQST